MNQIVDLRSDTITKPTEEMIEAMRKASVGDDVYREDSTIERLQELAAEKLGKEAALFVPSGTMGNLLAILTHTQRGEEVILEAGAHIFQNEVGGMASVAGVSPYPVKGKKGILQAPDVEAAIKSVTNIHYPRTSLVCIENSHNNSGGTVMGLEGLKEIRDVVKAHGLALHIDGARIFNAATTLNVDVKEITQYADSVMFCVSKGLCAPVGSLLVGTNNFIDRARKFRKMVGGGMRQAGYLAAAAIIAVEKMVGRLGEDHANAKKLAEMLTSISGVSIDLESVQTNMVNADFSGLGMDTTKAIAKLAEKGIKVIGRPPTQVRMVLHRHITSSDVDYVIETIKEIAATNLTE